MRQATLGQAERAQLYRDPDNGRILGFGPEGCKPAFPLGTRYTTTTLFYARDIERYAAIYRDQCLRDVEEKTLATIEREAPLRKSIRDAILERNNHVDERNKALNLALLNVMDTFYERARAKRLKVEIAMASERFEEGTSSIDIAQQSVYLKEEKRGR